METTSGTIDGSRLAGLSKKLVDRQEHLLHLHEIKEMFADKQNESFSLFLTPQRGAQLKYIDLNDANRALMRSLCSLEIIKTKDEIKETEAEIKEAVT